MYEHLQNLSELSAVEPTIIIFFFCVCWGGGVSIHIILDSVIASRSMGLTSSYYSQMACPHNKF